MKKGLLTTTIITYTFLLVMIIYFFTQFNVEFIGYSLVVGILYFLIIIIQKKYNLPTYSIVLFSIWIFLHILGGAVSIINTRLYDLIIIDIYRENEEFVLLKYDQLIHLYCYLSISIIIYFILKNYFKINSKSAIIIFTILSASGVGMLNEIIEFFMVVFANASKAVGGYFNTSLDIIFNLIGSILGSIIAMKTDKK